MKKCIAFTGGGTGGHIFPGLAIASFFHSLPEIECIWIGNNSGMDKTLVEKSASVDHFYGIPCGKFRRYFSVRNFFDFFKIAAGFIAAFFILLRLRPVFLFSKGGFVSVAPCYAAFLLRIPVYTHECDFSPGLATKLNAKVAKGVFLSYEQTKTFFKKSNVSLIVTGNPVRQIFYHADAQAGLDFLQIPATHKKPLLLVLGGSGGAKQINDLVLENLSFLCEHFIVIHQTGNNFDKTQVQSSDVCAAIDNKSYHFFDFIHEQMPHVLACADIVLSRSGANALWEAAVCHKALLLIPLSGSGTRGDQIENANFFAQNHAALVLQANDINGHTLQQSLLQFCNDAFRADLSKNIQELTNNENPAKVIFDYLCKEVLLV